MGLLQQVRSWLQDWVPISEPTVLRLKVDEVVNDFGVSEPPGQLRIPFLIPPARSGDLASLPIPEQTLDQTLKASGVELHTIDGLRVAAPNCLDLQLARLLDIPAILDLFTGLTLPGSAGKPTTGVVGKLDMSTCPHGLPRYSCAVCSTREKPTGRTKKRRGIPKRRAPTLDVFDLLLPFLQPPIESLLDHPLLWPEGRRPYGYQVQGVKFLTDHPSALLADEMGLGKTIQTIIALQVLYRRGEIFRVLILCRTSLLGTWEHELAKWAPELHVLKVRGNRDEREWLWRAPSSIYLTTYATARQDVFRESGSLLPRFDVVVLDEVQDIKNPRTKQTRAVRQTPAEYRWGLSGTPVENKPEDVVSIFGYLRPRLFRATETYPPREVKHRIQPYFLRRRAADVLDDLPDKVSREVWLDLDPRQHESYDRVFNEGRQTLSRADATRTHALSIITKLQEICNRDPASGRSCKLEYLRDQLDTVVDSGQKALVFSRLPNVTLQKIMPELRQFSPALFHGGLRDAQRQELLRRFQEDDTPRIMLMSVQAGGVGLNLQRANHVFHFDHWWNPAVTKQAEARAHRIGQTRKVFVHDLYTRDTVEERVHQIIRRKQEMFDRIIDDLSVEHVRTTFSDEELFGVFGLKPPKPTRPSTRAAAVAPPVARGEHRVSSPRRETTSASQGQLNRSQPAGGPTNSMSDEVRLTLVRLVRDEGQGIKAPQQLVNLLRDLCPDDGFEVNLLKLSLAERIPNTLNKGWTTQPSATLRAVLAQRLVSNWGMHRRHADWVVDVWVEALRP